MFVVSEFFLKICHVFGRKPFTLWNLINWTCEFCVIHIFVFTNFDYLSKGGEPFFRHFFPVFFSIPDKHFFSCLLFRALPFLLVGLVSVFCLFSFFVNTFFTFIDKIFWWLDNFLHIKFPFSVNRNTAFHQFVSLSSVENFKSRSPTKIFTFIII